MCSADFAATCRIVYGQHTKGKHLMPLLDEMGCVQRRKHEKPAVIRSYRRSQEKYPEKFYGTFLRPRVPYRSDQELKRPHLPTGESFHSSCWVQLPGSEQPQYVRRFVKRNRDKYEKNSDEIENAVEEFEQNKGLIDERCNLDPAAEVDRLECVEELEERQPLNEREDVPEYGNQANAVPGARAIREAPAFDPAVLRHMYQNQKQACMISV
ncbi:hypothetical protein KUCAC02_034841 [Chaenocephalus aceratus]|nr:hypothetical protein KUCAC02_034841 [Chaenocephalus aceratus]